MAEKNYEVTLYRVEFKLAVVEILKDLWSEDTSENLLYFEWKYEDNPYTHSPFGIVVLYGDEVVGFRGYFTTRFEVPGRNNQITMLVPGDTCVHPDHQRKGLSVLMGDLAKKEFVLKHALFFNTTCTRKSLPGYKRMGFLPLVPKVFMTRSSLAGIVKYTLIGRANRPIHESKIELGIFGGIEVSNRPRPSEMAVLVAAQQRRENRIILSQNEEFFSWRFRNPKGKYVFYYSLEAESLTGYVVIGVSSNNRRGFIVDWAGDIATTIEKILIHIIRSRHFDLVSIYDYCLDTDFAELLERLGFDTGGLVRIIEDRLNGQMPLLIRPIKDDYSEDDFLIEGVDSRKIENWSLKPIFSDAT